MSHLLRRVKRGLAVLVLAGRVGAQELPPHIASELDSLVGRMMTRAGVPGLSVAVAVDGRLAWSKGFGLANLEHQIPASPRTPYRSASIGKAITATAAMRLVEHGKLDLDVPIQRYCPAFPAKRWPLTARHLLTHTGGIRHYGGPRHEEEATSNRHYPTIASWLPVIAADTLLFAPGTRYHYSTYGYNLLGCVMEGASGRPFLAFMREAVFGPAGMRDTRDDDPGAIAPGRAGGYMRVDGVLRHATFVDMSNRMPAGGYLTTAEDLARFAIGFMTGGLVHTATRDSMLSHHRLADGTLIEYGLGWGLFAPGDALRGLKDAYHGGGSPGVTSYLYIVPARGFAVAMQMNLEGVGSARSDLAVAIAEAVLFPTARR